MALYSKLSFRLDAHYHALRKIMSEVKEDLQATKALLTEATFEINQKIQELTDAVEASTIDEETKQLARDTRAMAQSLADIVTTHPTPEPTPESPPEGGGV